MSDDDTIELQSFDPPSDTPTMDHAAAYRVLGQAEREHEMHLAQVRMFTRLPDIIAREWASTNRKLGWIALFFGVWAVLTFVAIFGAIVVGVMLGEQLVGS